MEPAVDFPTLDLPVRPPYAPMEALSVDALPPGEEWSFEPKWDGFRCLAFREGERVVLQSKSAQTLTRFFPELVAALSALPLRRVVFDGEIVVARDGRLDFDALLQRIHPAESRVRKLARETPVTYLVFDALVDDAGRDLTALPLTERRRRLEQLFAPVPAGGALRPSPLAPDRGLGGRWPPRRGAGGRRWAVCNTRGRGHRDRG